MKVSYTSSSLKAEILARQASCTRQEAEIRQTTGDLIESLKPANIIRNTFRSSLHSPGVGQTLLKGGLGLAAGFLSKQLFVMGSSNIIKKSIGTLVELGVAKAVANNANRIAQKGLQLFHKVTNKST